MVYAARPCIVFVDDTAVLMPSWWPEVHEAARHEYVVAGAYQKYWEEDAEQARGGAVQGSRSPGPGPRPLRPLL